MERKIIEQYFGKRVFMILKNSQFKYTFTFNENNLIGDTLSFTDKYGQSVHVDISEISMIKLAVQDQGRY